ncbi:uncharacterized protein SPSK_00017 [Sporothrix schenckii 1099-18]|uniref:LysM domain-containing protein n=1 Tax=Sporothrix schenckii 1099-18 TaxID=1397361 RepID=A0A0F2LV91_SPOSC|nr:uncharacterized protein SPSK_00017 [Sporothrix schenckii 1099-18]KJR79806.1 hypothetical protein SPSK_00017 [Sporothrix schenckii 1099-18]
MGRFMALALGLLAASPVLVAAVAVPVPTPAPVAPVAAWAPIAARGVDCYFQIGADDNTTCSEFAGEWALTVTEFQALNPGVVCPNLNSDTLYCVSGTVTGSSSSGAVGPHRSKTSVSFELPSGSGGPSSFWTSFSRVQSATSTTTSTTSSSSSISSSSSKSAGPPGPTQSGEAANCSNYHKVVKGDTCPNIEAAYGISADQFASWNPSVGTDCRGLLVGRAVCVGVPGATSSIVSVAPSSTSKSASASPSSSVPSGVPSPLQPGTFSNCTSYHKIVSGDTCSAIEAAADITAAQFAFWNSGVDSSCSNIDVGYYLCIAGGGDTGPSSGAPSPLQPGTLDNCTSYHKVVSGDTCGAIETAAGITAAQFAAWNSGVDSTCSNIDVGYYLCIAGGGDTGPSSGAPSPLQPGTLDNCTSYHKVVSGDTCGAIETAAGITAAQFAAWNSGVDSTCSNIDVGYYLCIAGGGDTGPSSGAPSPLQPGTLANCTSYHKVVSGDTCSAIETAAGITAAQFAAWNSGVDSTCSNIDVGYYLCIAGGGGTGSTTGAPSPLQPGTLSTCKTYHKVVSGDTCAAIEKSAGISAAEFAAWNSGVDSTCSNIDIGYYLCIGGGPAVSTPTTPSPLQPGTISTCKTFHKVVSGDTCVAIEKSAGITAAQFAKWNTGVNAECTNIDVGYYVCIGA